MDPNGPVKHRHWPARLYRWLKRRRIDNAPTGDPYIDGYRRPEGHGFMVMDPRDLEKSFRDDPPKRHDR